MTQAPPLSLEPGYKTQRIAVPAGAVSGTQSARTASAVSSPSIWPGRKLQRIAVSVGAVL